MPDEIVVPAVHNPPKLQTKNEAVDPRPPESTPKRIADRPHWITILIGFLSPSIALVAAWIAIQSLRTSQQSMKVGQRAYLNYQVAVANGNEIVEKLREDKD
jgi:hypothetical protein